MLFANRRWSRHATFALLCVLALSAAAVPAADPYALVLRGTTAKPFAEVIQELEFAITERNFRITGRNTIGKGLRERGYVGFPEVEVIHFCNLENAREVLLLDPDYVALMPCRATARATPTGTAVSVMLLPENVRDRRVRAFARRLNHQLREIFEFVLQKN